MCPFASARAKHVLVLVHHSQYHVHMLHKRAIHCERWLDKSRASWWQLGLATSPVGGIHRFRNLGPDVRYHHFRHSILVCHIMRVALHECWFHLRTTTYHVQVQLALASNLADAVCPRCRAVRAGHALRAV